MKIKSPDEFLLDQIDAITGKVEARGWTLPQMLKEILAAELVAVAAIAPLFYFEDGPYMGAFFLGLTSINAVFIHMMWKDAKADAEREWDEAMMRKYLKRAGQRRMGSIFRRQISLAGAVTLLVLAIAGAATGRLSPPDVAMLLWFVVSTLRMYVECALPKPPKRQQQFKPAFGLG